MSEEQEPPSFSLLFSHLSRPTPAPRPSPLIAESTHHVSRGHGSDNEEDDALQALASSVNDDDVASPHELSSAIPGTSSFMAPRALFTSPLAKSASMRSSIPSLPGDSLSMQEARADATPGSSLRHSKSNGITELLAMDDDMPVPTISFGAPLASGSTPPIVVGFMTGRKRAIAPPSEKALKIASEKLGLATDTVSSPPPSISLHSSITPPENFTPGFSTGPMKALAPQAEAAMKIANDSLSLSFAPSGAVPPANLTPAFSTSRMKAIAPPSDKAKHAVSQLSGNGVTTRDDVGSPSAHASEADSTTPDKRLSVSPTSARLRTPGSSKKARFAYGSPVAASPSPDTPSPSSSATSRPLSGSYTYAGSASSVAPTRSTPPFKSPGPLLKATQPPHVAAPWTSDPSSSAFSTHSGSSNSTLSPSLALSSARALYDLESRRNNLSRMSLRTFATRYAISGRPSHLAADVLLAMGVSMATLGVTYASAAVHRFDAHTARTSCAAFADAINEVGADEFDTALRRAGAQERELANGWSAHHFQLIVWKLACMDRAFPHAYATHRALTASRVWTQMCYRLERERAGHQSALKRVLAKDEASSRHMVLCVAHVCDTFAELWLTDGWYLVRAQLDTGLALQATVGRICVGHKLRVCGAKLTGDKGVSPLEQPVQELPALVLHINGTRRAAWHTPLGFQRKPLFCIPLRSVRPDGGLVPAMDVCVLRRYAPLIYDRKERVYRTTAEEEENLNRHMDEQNKRYEAKLAITARQVRASPEALLEHPATLLALLSSALLDISDLSVAQQKAVRKYAADGATSGLDEEGKEERETAWCVSLRMADAPGFAQAHALPQDAELIVWQPSEEWMHVPEGCRIRLFYVRPPNTSIGHNAPNPVATATAPSTMQSGAPVQGTSMNGGRTSGTSGSSTLRMALSRPSDPVRLRHIACPLFMARVATPLALAASLMPGSEFDTVLVVLAHGHIHSLPPRPNAPPGVLPQHLRTLFLCAPTSQLVLALQIRAPASLLTARYPNADVGKVLCLSNIAWRRPVGGLLIASATERALISLKHVPTHLRALSVATHAWRAEQPHAVYELAAVVQPLLVAHEEELAAKE